MAQQRIDQVEFSFLKKTKSNYLHHFITQKAGSLYDSTRLVEDYRQLVNLDLFYNLQQEVKVNGDQVTVSYSGEEKRTVLPIINFGGIKDNFWFQLGGFDAHFRGRGELFGAFYTHYDRSSVNVFYKAPFIGLSNYGIEANIQKLATREPVYFRGNDAIYHYDNFTLEFIGVYWLNLRNRLKLGIAFLDEVYEKVSETALSAELPEFVNHKKWIIKSKWESGQLNYYANLINGVDNQMFFEIVVSGPTGIFWKYLNQFRAFKRLGQKHNLAARLRFGLSAQADSPFVPFVLDSYINIRGSGNRVARGTGELVLNLEYRYNIWETQWGIFQAVGFWDLGGWRPIQQNFEDLFLAENSTSFAGFGGRVYFKKIYNLTLRADLGFNLSRPSNNGIVLGIGQYF